MNSNERVTGVNHNTVINWVKQVGTSLTDAPESSEIPKVTQVDELETFVGKKNKLWLWTAVNKAAAGVFAWVLRDRSANIFAQLWQIIRCWKNFFYAIDSYAVYPVFINDANHIVKKI